MRMISWSSWRKNAFRMSCAVRCWALFFCKVCVEAKFHVTWKEWHWEHGIIKCNIKLWEICSTRRNLPRHTHTHTHTHTHSLSLSHTHTHTHTHSLSQSHTHTHTHTHMHYVAWKQISWFKYFHVLYHTFSMCQGSLLFENRTITCYFSGIHRYHLSASKTRETPHLLSAGNYVK
jgi:hypothetical protein